MEKKIDKETARHMILSQRDGWHLADRQYSSAAIKHGDDVIGTITGTWLTGTSALHYLTDHPTSKYWDQVANIIGNYISD